MENIKGQAAKQCPSDKYEMLGYLRKALEYLKKTSGVIMGFFRRPECGFTT